MSSYRRIVVLFGLAVMMASTGCTYLKNRGNDASDIFEIGITYTPHLKPVFALYWNPFNVLPFGYVNVNPGDITLLGWSDRQVGALDIDFHGWGALAWGSQRLGIGHVQPAAEGGPGRPLGWSVTEPGHTYTTGFIGAPFGGNSPPGRTFGECPKLLSLGWIGIYANCSVIDLPDFVLGWTTLDIGHDDAPDYMSVPTGGIVDIDAISVPGMELKEQR
jgi:hypothetical protein